MRVHRKLRHAGVDAVLQVYEGQSHAQYLDPFVPETEEAMSEIARFLIGAWRPEQADTASAGNARPAPAAPGKQAR